MPRYWTHFSLQTVLGGSSQDSVQWLITMVIGTSPKDRVVGPLPSGLLMAYKWGLLTTYDTWDDPPSGAFPSPIRYKSTRPPVFIAGVYPFITIHRGNDTTSRVPKNGYTPQKVTECRPRKGRIQKERKVFQSHDSSGDIR